MRGSTRLLDVGDDILTSIVSYLDYDDRKSLAATCTRLRDAGLEWFWEYEDEMKSGDLAHPDAPYIVQWLARHRVSVSLIVESTEHENDVLKALGRGLRVTQLLVWGDHAGDVNLRPWMYTMPYLTSLVIDPSVDAAADAREWLWLSPNLLDLDLSGINLSTIPRELSRLTSLTRLNVSSNGVAIDADWSVLPRSLVSLSARDAIETLWFTFDLPKLKTLVLGSAKFSTPEVASRLPPSLTFLDMSECRRDEDAPLGAPLVDFWDDFFERMVPKLRHLVAPETGMAHVPPALATWTHLTHLDLSFNNFGPEAARELPPNLESLTMSMKEGMECAVDMRHLGRLTNLTLYVERERVTDWHLPPSLASMTVAHCDTCPGPDVMRGLTSLTKMHVRASTLSHAIFPPGLVDLEIAMSSAGSDVDLTALTALTKLDMTLHAFGGIVHLPSGVLDVGMTGCRVAALPTSLTSLELDHCIIGDDATFAGMSGLRDLYLKKMRLPDTAILPTTLTSLGLVSCGLTGLPSGLEDMRHLRSLILEDNPGLASVRHWSLPPNLRVLHAIGCEFDTAMQTALRSILSLTVHL